MRVLKKLAAMQKEHTYEAGVELAWWEDNAGHLAAGFAIGALTHALLGFSYVGVGMVFLALAAAWEAYEHVYEVRPWDPTDGWSLDRAIEDTILDTYIGLTGALLSVLIF